MNLSRSLGIHRAFVERVRPWGGGLCLSAVYRGGRVYGCMDENLRLTDIWNENDFISCRDWDFRALALGEEGNIVIMGSRKDDVLEFYSLSPGRPPELAGRTAGISYGAGLIRCSEGWAVHTPPEEGPVTLLDENFNRLKVLGVYSPDRTSLESRMGQVHKDGDGGFRVVLENYPARLIHMDKRGNQLTDMAIETADRSVDHLTVVMDSSVCPHTGRIALLIDEAGGTPELKFYGKDGVLEATVKAKPHTRRICLWGENKIALVTTSFGIIHMILSMSIYGCVVTSLHTGIIR